MLGALALLMCGDVVAQSGRDLAGLTGQRGESVRLAQAAGERARELALEAVASAPAGGQHTTESGDVVNLSGDVQIEADQTVEGDVVAIGGAARVHGQVKGNVIALGGSVYLPNGAEVAGDVVSFGGTITREPKATVGGSTMQMPGTAPETETGGPAPEAPAAEEAPPPEPPKAPPVAELPPPAPPPAEAPQKGTSTPGGRHRAEIVQFGQPVRVAADETVDGNVVSMGGPVSVHGHVRGDVVAIGGPVDIEGRVDGTTVSIGGPLDLSDKADVRGDAVAVGGPLDTSGGATVRGQTVSVGGPLGSLPGLTNIMGASSGMVPGLAPLVGIMAAAAGWLSKTLAMLIVLALVVLVLPRQTEVIGRSIDEQPGRALLYGLVGWLLVLPILVILIVLIVTWVLVPVYLLALAALLIVGYVGLTLYLGRHVVHLASRRVESVLGLALVGFVLLALIDLMKPLPVVGFVTGLVTVVVLIFSLGGALMTRFGTDPTGSWLSGRTAAASISVDGPAPAGAAEPPPASPEADPADEHDLDDATRRALSEVEAEPETPSPPDEPQGPPIDDLDEAARQALDELPPEDEPPAEDREEAEEPEGPES